MRAPSSFHSTDAGPTSASAADDVGRARGEHGEDAASHLEPDVVESVRSLGERDHRRPAQIAGQHRGPAYERGRHRRGPCDGVTHEAAERALAQLTDEEAPQEVGLGRRRPLEESAQDLLTGGGRTASGHGLELLERPIDVGDRRASAQPPA